MSEHGQRLRIRLFLTISLLLLVSAGAFFVTWPQAMATAQPKGQVYLFRFPDASGVKPGTDVRLSGVIVGKVEKVELDDRSGVVTVTVRINPGFTIRKLHLPTVVRGLPSGDTTVDLRTRPVKPGQQPDRDPADPKQPIVGAPPADVRRLVVQGTELVDKSSEAIDKTSKEIESLRKSVDDLLPTMKATTKEVGDLAKEVRRALPAAESTVKEVGELSRAVRQAVPELRKTNEEAQKLIKSVTEIVPTVRDVLGEVKVGVGNWSKVGERVNVFLATNEDDLDQIVKNLNATTEGMSLVFGKDNQQALSEVLSNLVPASKHFPEVTRTTVEFLKEIRGTLRNFDDVLKNVRELTDPDSDTSKGALKNVRAAMIKLNSVLDDVQTILQTAARKDGTVRRFLADPALYNHLDDAALGMTRLLPRLDRALKDFEVFADKIARHPESIGLGGFVRPDAGIKEPPVRKWSPRP